MIRGRGMVTVEDRIGWGTQLDIWMPSCAEADNYGRQEVEIARG
jgi:3D (Asp-Asp-Asp) domain-containing protein